MSRAEISEYRHAEPSSLSALNAGQLPAALATAGGKLEVLIVDAREDSHLDGDRRLRPAAGNPAGRLGGSAGAGSPPAPRQSRSPLAVVGSMSEMAQRPNLLRCRSIPEYG
ncbi:hypothetical protein MJ561_14450 [Klebsiella pneumoniae]|nr:hypothetical protein MJ561_14450 [Klebsiella pneumoniae]